MHYNNSWRNSPNRPLLLIDPVTTMQIKVCGMREADNISQLNELPIQLIGFIFYDRSPRYAGGRTPTPTQGVKRIGVFVNETTEKILSIVKEWQLDGVQLHGNESAEQCRELRRQGLFLLKAIPIATIEDLRQTKPYLDCVDLLLFDTRCEGHGGSGKKFDWDILRHYQERTPFLLSGGINLESAPEIRSLNHPQMMGVDLNSQFEISPGIKNIPLLRQFLTLINYGK